MNEKGKKLLYMILSLLFAVAFWFYVDNVEGNTITSTFNNIAVEFIGETDTLPNRGLMLMQNEKATVDLVLRGPRSVITSLNSSDLRIQVDLSNITAAGTYPLTYRLLTPDNVSSSSITTEKASVSTVTVRVVALSEKTIPVRVAVTGEVAENHIYMTQMMVAQPSSITISGLEEDVDPVTEALVEINLTGAIATVTKDMSYKLLDENGNVLENDGSIRVSDKRIHIVAPVYELKTLPLVVRLVEAPGSSLENVEWTLSINSIEVAGEAASLRNVNSLDIGEVDLSAWLSDTEIELDITIPSAFINISGDTSATLSIKYVDVETRAFTVTDITAIGLIEGKTFSRMTNSVDVVVRGPAEDLEHLTPENIRIVVDLSKYSYSGTFSFPATVIVDGFSQVGAVGSYTIAGKIS